MKYIKTWAERCEEHPDHNGIVTERMIQARMQEEIDDLRAALAEPMPDYERGFIDGMQEQMKRSVDKAVNRMAVPPQPAEPVQQAGKHEIKNLSDYEFKTYKIGGAELEAGFYSTDELRDLVKSLER